MHTMSPQLQPVILNGVPLLVETRVVPGHEPVSGLDKAGAKVVHAFDDAQQAIVELAGKLGHTVSEMGDRAIHPNQVEVEFGLAFGSNGGIILVGASVEASLKVTITYGRAGFADDADRPRP